MKSLYNEYKAYNDEGNKLSDATEIAVESMFKEYLSHGFCPREISHIMQNAIAIMESEIVIRAAVEKYKAEKTDDE